MIICGNGSLRKKHNKYYFRFRYKDYNGIVHQIERAGSSSKIDTNKMMYDMMKQIEEDYNINNISLEKYCYRFLEYIKENRSANTYQARECVANKYIIGSDIASCAINSITVHQMNIFLDSINCTDKQRNYIYDLLKYIFNRAYKEQFLTNNIFDHIDRPCRVKKSEKSVISVAELQSVFNFLCQDLNNYKNYILYVYLQFLYETGCRRGEALALTWNSIDFKNKIVKIDKSIIFVHSQEIVSDTKTKSSVRELLISEKLCSLLVSYRKSLKVITEFVFVWQDGSRISYIYFLNAFKRVQINLGFDVIYSLHSIRHLNATILNNFNINVKVIQQRLGHSNTNITMNTYVHPDIGNQNDCIDVLDNI